MRLRRVVINGYAFLTLLSIFRIPRSWLRIKCRNERRARNSAHGHDHCNRWSFLCTQLSRIFFSLFFFYFLCDQEISSLVISFSKHCARKKKTEEVRKSVAKRATTNGFSFFGFFLGSKEWEVIVTIISLCSFQQ